MIYRFAAEIAVCEVTGELDGWNVRFREEKIAEELSVVHLELSAERDRNPPETVFAFEVPQRDAQVKWHPQQELFDCHHYQPRWWRGGREPFAFNRNVPVYSCMNLEGINSMSFACSETFRPVYCSCGPDERSSIRTGLTLFSCAEEPCAFLHVAIRVDRRRIFYAEVLREMVRWYELMPEHSPALPVPEVARLPFYSSWYQYQKDVSQKELEEELPYIKQVGLRSVIIDDGWQCRGIEGGGSNMRSCGEWKPFPGKFPDLKALVEKFHANGIRCLLWVALPFVGVEQSALLERFQGKFLPGGGDRKVLDPRFPEVRDWLTASCCRLVRDYQLDGLKLDFIDSIAPDAAGETALRGRDTVSLMEGIERLLSGIRRTLTALNPDIIIEFRQHYTGPRMRKYGNVFRAADCAHDLLQNRMRTIDLRLLGGTSALLSDMVFWSEYDSVQVAARQILHVLFSVPQISVRLSGESPEKRRMLAFWMRFCTEHRNVLQGGKLRPEHPELSYPVVTASGEDEAVTAVYQTGLPVRLRSDVRHIIVNAKHTEELLLDTDCACTVRLFDVFGDPAGERNLVPGINRLSVPCSGMAVCDRHHCRQELGSKF